MAEENPYVTDTRKEATYKMAMILSIISVISFFIIDIITIAKIDSLYNACNNDDSCISQYKNVMISGKYEKFYTATFLYGVFMTLFGFVALGCVHYYILYMNKKGDYYCDGIKSMTGCLWTMVHTLIHFIIKAVVCISWLMYLYEHDYKHYDYSTLEKNTYIRLAPTTLSMVIEVTAIWIVIIIGYIIAYITNSCTEMCCDTECCYMDIDDCGCGFSSGNCLPSCNICDCCCDCDDECLNSMCTKKPRVKKCLCRTSDIPAPENPKNQDIEMGDVVRKEQPKKADELESEPQIIVGSDGHCSFYI